MNAQSPIPRNANGHTSRESMTPEAHFLTQRRLVSGKKNSSTRLVEKENDASPAKVAAAFSTRAGSLSPKKKLTQPERIQCDETIMRMDELFSPVLHFSSPLNSKEACTDGSLFDEELADWKLSIKSATELHDSLMALKKKQQLYKKR